MVVWARMSLTHARSRRHLSGALVSSYFYFESGLEDWKGLGGIQTSGSEEGWRWDVKAEVIPNTLGMALAYYSQWSDLNHQE